MKLAVVEVLDRDGHARLTVPVWQWPVTVGRAVGCDVVLDDAHAAPLHATLSDEDGALTLHVGETVNGVAVDGRRHGAHSRATVSRGGTFTVGTTTLRVRLAADPVADERPLTRAASGSRRQALIVVAAFTAWSMAEHWLATDPGGPFTDRVFVVLGVLLLVVTWSGAWSIGSKLVRHRFDFWPHVMTASSYALAMGVIVLVLPLVSYASGLTLFSRLSGLVGAAIGWALVTAHLRLMLPVRPRVLTAVMSVLFVAALAVQMTHTYQTYDRLMTELYVSTIGPPAIRVAPVVDVARFVAEARALEAVLTRHAVDDADAAATPPTPAP